MDLLYQRKEIKMYRFYLAAIDLLPAILLLIPLYWILNRVYFHNAKTSFFYLVFSCYLAVVYVLVGLPNVTYIRPEVNLNLIPIIGISNEWQSSLLNILLFVPLGMMLPILWKVFRKMLRTLLFGFTASLTIELLQMLTFRATDVNDLITNTVGTALGFICINAFHRNKQIAEETASTDAVIVIAAVLLVMFFLYPFASTALWNFVL